MSIRTLILTCALGALAAAPAAGEGAAPPPARAKSPAPPAARPGPVASGRTLDAIHIEGEVAVPQVLFITARDQRRFLDSQHRRYQRTGLQLGAALVPPARLSYSPPPSSLPLPAPVVNPASVPAPSRDGRKEESR